MSWQREKDEDYRQQLTVFLVRENRPKYWEFHCVYCGQKVCELDGNAVQIRDVASDSATNTGLRIRCPGSSKWCRLWYEFVLG